MTISPRLSVSFYLIQEIIDYREGRTDKFYNEASVNNKQEEGPDFTKKVVVELALLGIYLLNLVETVFRLALGIIMLMVVPFLDCLQGESGSIWSGLFLLTGAVGFSKIFSMTQLFYSNFANKTVDISVLKINTDI